MTKRKYDDCFAAEDSFDKIVTDNDENENYKAAMNFVAKFKKERKKEWIGLPVLEKDRVY